MEEKNTLYKLMVLYMLSKVDFSMTFAQMADFILAREYTDYFTLQGSLSELVDSGLVHSETVRNVSYYTITPEGTETIGYFTGNINIGIRDEINEYLKKNSLAMRNENSVRSVYYRNTSGSYTVHCYVKEKEETLIDLSLSVPTPEQAKAICLRWDKKCQDVYAYLMKELMKQ